MRAGRQQHPPARDHPLALRALPAEGEVQRIGCLPGRKPVRRFAETVMRVDGFSRGRRPSGVKALHITDQNLDSGKKQRLVAVPRGDSGWGRGTCTAKVTPDQSQDT